MTAKTVRHSSPLAALLVAVAIRFLPTDQRSRYRNEWMAELEEMRRLHIAQTPPALRILLGAPAVGRVLGTTQRRRFTLPVGWRIRRIGDRMFAENDAEGYWWGWQITRLAGGLGRRYRDQRFDNPFEPGQRGLRWPAGPSVSPQSGGTLPYPGPRDLPSGHHSSRVRHGPACLRKDRPRGCSG
jgi:hypothetical protein